MAATYRSIMRAKNVGFIAYKAPGDSVYTYCGSLRDWTWTPARDETLKIPHGDSYENSETLVGTDRFATATIQEPTPALVAAMYGESLSTSAVKAIGFREEKNPVSHADGFQVVTPTNTSVAPEALLLETSDGTILSEVVDPTAPTADEEFSVVQLSDTSYAFRLSEDFTPQITYSSVYCTYLYQLASGGQKVLFTPNPTGDLPTFNLLLVHQQIDLRKGGGDHLAFRTVEIANATLRSRPTFGGSLRDLENLQLEFRVRNQVSGDMAVHFGDVVREVS